MIRRTRPHAPACRRASARAGAPGGGLAARAALGVVAALLLGAAGCDPGGAGPPSEEVTPLTLTLENVPSLDPDAHGSYEAWVVAGDGSVRSAGRFRGPGSGIVSLESPISNPEELFLTVEPPGDADASPSEARFLGGEVREGRAELGHNRYLTPGVPLQPEPGTHVLFTPSNNDELGGVNTNEDAGVWMFNIDPPGGARPDNPDYYLTYTPLSPGWIYEGWVVRDHGSGDEVWLSYGKFEPTARQKIDTLDSTGFGPFSGRLRPRELRFANEIDFPGDDWVSNAFDLPVPGGLELPLDLNGCRAGPEACAAAGQEFGDSRYTHVVTIEPRRELEEDRWIAEDPVAAEEAVFPEPFPLLRPYRNPIGNAPPPEPRTIEYHPEELPAGVAELGS